MLDPLTATVALLSFALACAGLLVGRRTPDPARRRWQQAPTLRQAARILHPH